MNNETLPTGALERRTAQAKVLMMSVSESFGSSQDTAGPVYMNGAEMSGLSLSDPTSAHR